MRSVTRDNGAPCGGIIDGYLLAAGIAPIGLTFFLTQESKGRAARDENAEAKK